MTNQNINPTSDHDLLIRLDVKLQRVSDDIKELKDGITTRVIAIEQRVTNLETTNRELEPDLVKQTVAANAQWIHDFKLTWKTMITAASTIGALVGFVLSVLVQVFQLFGR